MASLTKMAAQTVLTDTQIVLQALGTVSENLADIKLYVDDNKEYLPGKSEVSPGELESLIKRNIQEVQYAQDKLTIATRWLNILITDN